LSERSPTGDPLWSRATGVSIRARLLLVFSGLALVAIGGMALAAIGIVRGRADAHARVDFRGARDQLKRSLALRYQAFQAASDLSYVLPVFRQVAGDDADFGLGTAEDDRARLETLHRNLVDADWNWAQTAGTGFVAVADAKGRLLYASAQTTAFGMSAQGLLNRLKLFEPTSGYAGSAILSGRDPQLVQWGLLPPGGWPGLLIVFARTTVLNGQPRAVFLQGIAAKTLLDDIALGESGTALALIALDGQAAGSMPQPVLKVAQRAGSDETQEAMADGARWLVQRMPVFGLDGRTVVGAIAVGRNLDVGFAALEQTGTSLLAVAAVLLLLGLVASLWLSQRVAEPVVELERAAYRVAGGDLDVQVPVRSRDEIGRLAATFNRMTEGLRERDRIKFTFKKYLAPEVVDYLLAHPEAQNPGGERRELTVMFTDLAHFTKFAESRGPEEVVEALNTCLADLSAAIAGAGGTLDKFIGDNVMAFFGAPIPRPDHALRACQAALRQVTALDTLAPRWRSGAWPELDLRVGINTGDMIVGTIGGGQGQDYTVIGDAVNLAARLESANKTYGTRILCSEATWHLVQGRLEGREVDLVRVQGKAQAVRIFEVLGEPGFLAANPKKQRVVALFREGLEAWQAGSMPLALDAFQAAVTEDPSDGPSRTFLARTEQYLREPPAEPWDGVHQLDHK
jgi:class 3 adenylate cyclase